ncbi:hypothetical protein ACWDTG_23175 [Rhodococcus zopfii]|uniref:hypothetical protein n=1 Tax=Rhodococcus zopfii TaxID=43772 RepID=UPI0011114028|nr:hypothetical protein [Rhodococcus zopfii]
MTATLFEQLPRFSEFDPGAAGEGSLDPLGFGSVADRIADRLAPGLRARMSQPRFVTLSAVGAHACQPIADLVSADGKTTVDIAFEWLVVESLVQHPNPARLRGVPGSQKAQRARKTKQRLSAATYLAGPRVFGFTGVYRPFSQDSLVLGTDGLPGENAERLIRAWESDRGFDGFLAGTRWSDGGKLRADIERECRETLRRAHVTAALTGGLMRRLADTLAPGEAGRRERDVLRNLTTTGPHEVRNELTALLIRMPPAADATQQQIAGALAAQVTPRTRQVLKVAIDFENCSTGIEYAFRRLLAYGTSLGGTFSIEQGATTPGLADLAPHLGDLVKRAVDSAARLDDMLAYEVMACLDRFDRDLDAGGFVEALIDRHQQVQDGKGKRMWLDPIRQMWIVRPPYRNQRLDLDDDIWTHPMRLHTLVSFLQATA